MLDLPEPPEVKEHVARADAFAFEHTLVGVGLPEDGRPARLPGDGPGHEAGVASVDGVRPPPVLRYH